MGPGVARHVGVVAVLLDSGDSSLASAAITIAKSPDANAGLISAVSSSSVLAAIDEIQASSFWRMSIAISSA
jgi:hypothetical protein